MMIEIKTVFDIMRNTVEKEEENYFINLNTKKIYKTKLFKDKVKGNYSIVYNVKFYKDFKVNLKELDTLMEIWYKDKNIIISLEEAKRLYNMRGGQNENQ